MEKFIPPQGNQTSGVIVSTDNRWKEFKSGSEVPKRVMKSRFDYLSPEEQDGDGFLQWRGTWYHLSEFMGSLPFGLTADWTGQNALGLTNAILIKLHPDGEQYKIGYVYMASPEFWAERQAKKHSGKSMTRNGEPDEGPSLEISDTREVPIVNPGDYDWTRGLFLFGFGAYNDTKCLVFANGVEAALEIAASHLKDTGEIGFFETDEALKGLYDEVREEHPEYSEEQAQQAAEADLTYTESGYLVSYEWTVDDVPELLEQAKAISREYEESRG